jgi:hypothetical protein
MGSQFTNMPKFILGTVARPAHIISISLSEAPHATVLMLGSFCNAKLDKSSVFFQVKDFKFHQN